MNNPLTRRLNIHPKPVENWRTDGLSDVETLQKRPEGVTGLSVSPGGILNSILELLLPASPCVDVSSHHGYMHVDNLLKALTF